MGIPSAKPDENRMVPSPEFINFAVDRAGDTALIMDDRARIVYANRTASRTLRYTIDELYSMTLFDIDPGLSSETWKRRWTDLRERGTLLFQTEYHRKDGTRVPVEAVFSFIQHGGVEYSCSFARNMAARQRVDNLIRLGRAELEKTLDAIPDWICLIDLDSKILRTNRRAEEISGLSLRNIIGQSCCEVLHGSGDVIHECPLPKMIKTKKRECVEFQLQDSQWKMITVDPVVDERGHITGAVHSIRDITSRKEKEAKGEKQLGDLSREVQRKRLLNGPLPICSGCKKIRDDQGDWTSIEHYIGRRTGAEFSHSICPECAKILYPYLDLYDQE